MLFMTISFVGGWPSVGEAYDDELGLDLNVRFRPELTLHRSQAASQRRTIAPLPTDARSSYVWAAERRGVV